MSRPRFRTYPVKGPRTEAGAALLAFLLVLLVGGSYALLRDAKSLAQRAALESSRKTSEALAEAKAALIGYAVAANLTPPGRCAIDASRCPRPGDLPCPDRNNDGYAENSPRSGPPSDCGSVNGSNPESRLARLPLKTLKLSDLRDGSGEQLWYAVSNGFKERTRTVCGSSGCLNSDSRGTITVKVAGADMDGDGDPDAQETVHDGTNPDEWTPSGAIAVLFAPGQALQRQDGIIQNRTSACQRGIHASSAECAKQYLDNGIDEDNSDFEEGNDNGFIQGDIVRCTAGNCSVVVNDRLLAITYQDLIPALEKRVVGEVLACVRAYAKAHGGRVPWAASIKDVSEPYSDAPAPGENPDRFGRLPDYPFTRTNDDASDMSTSWLPGCLLRQTSGASARWWLNWKELVFYGVANAYEPQPTPPHSTPDPCGAEGKCLAVNPLLPPPPDLLPPCEGSTHVVVMASGKRLPAVPDDPEPQTAPSGITTDQRRQFSPDKVNILNYLESYNATVEGDSLVDAQGPCSILPNPSYVYFKSGKATTTFNDIVGYLPPPRP